MLDGLLRGVQLWGQGHERDEHHGVLLAQSLGVLEALERGEVFLPSGLSDAAVSGVCGDLHEHVATVEDGAGQNDVIGLDLAHAQHACEDAGDDRRLAEQQPDLPQIIPKSNQIKSNSLYYLTCRNCSGIHHTL